MNKKLESVTIYGELQGNLWWPNVECTKDVKEVFTQDDRPFTRKWTGLRDALLHITNCGDFQNCALSYAVMVIRWTDGKKRIEVSADVPLCKLTADCFVS